MNEVQAGSCKQHKGAFFIIGGQGRMTNNNLFVFFFSQFECPGFGYWPAGACSPEFYECVMDQNGNWIAHHFYCPGSSNTSSYR